MSKRQFFTASDIPAEALRRHGIRVLPRDVSDLFYARRLDVTRCPVLAGRRLIPRDYLEDVLQALISRGPSRSEEEPTD
jgi:hypothetical protein